MRRFAITLLLLLLSNSALAQFHQSDCADAAMEAQACCAESGNTSVADHEETGISAGSETHPGVACPASSCHFGHCCALKTDAAPLTAAFEPIFLLLPSAREHTGCSLFRFERPPRA